MLLLGLRLRQSEMVLASFAAVTAAVWAIKPVGEILFPVWIVSFGVSLVLGSAVWAEPVAGSSNWWWLGRPVGHQPACPTAEAALEALPDAVLP